MSHWGLAYGMEEHTVPMNSILPVFHPSQQHHLPPNVCPRLWAEGPAVDNLIPSFFALSKDPEASGWKDFRWQMGWDAQN